MIAVTSCLRLEVETTPPAGKTKSLVKNPDGALGGFFWVTPTGGLVQKSLTLPGWFTYVHTTGGTVFRTERMPVTAGQNVSARWLMQCASGTISLVATIVFEDANGATISTTAASPAYTTAPATERLYGPFVAPANTVNARLVFTPGGAGLAAGTNISLSGVGFVARTSGAAVVWATDVVFGPTWLDVLAPAVEIDVERQALDLGTLSATIRDATLDPLAATTIRPGRGCRLSALHGTTAAWEVLFEGELTDFDVQYEAAVLAKRPGDPKHCRITLAATDRTRTLASVRRPEGVSTLADLRDTLEDAGVPWSINGDTAHTGVAPTVISYNENATALDQVAITRDSRAAHAWLDRRGVLQVWDRSRLVPFANTGFEVDVSGWQGGGGSVPTLSRVTTPVAAGTGAMRIVTTGAGAGSVTVATTPAVRVIPGHSYAVSVKTRAAATPRQARVSLNWRTASGGNAGTTTGALTTNSTTAYTTHTVTAAPGVIPADAVSVLVIVEIMAVVAAETHYVDDLQGLNAEVVLDQALWTEIEIGGGSQQCINEVTVDYLRLVPATGTEPAKSEVVPYGPYRNEASIADYGVRPRKFTIHGTSEAADVAALAAAVLAANAAPAVAASSVTFPVKATSDLVQTRALGDLQQAALVSFATKGYAATLRITGVRHSIRSDAKYKARWIVTYTFEDTSTVAAPRSIPTPPSGFRSSGYQTFAPAFSSSAGALGGATGTLRYRLVNGTVHWSLNATITAIGTGSGGFRFTLPVNAAAGATHLGTGRESASTGVMLSVTQIATNQAQVVDHNNANVVFAGRTFNLSGSYEAA